MTKREAIRQNEQEDRLRELGFTRDEASALRRISMQLHRWHELECGTDSYCVVRGTWDRDKGEFVYDDNGKPYYEFAGGSGRARYQQIADRESGAKARLRAIIKARNTREAVKDANGNVYPHVSDLLTYYIQTDPRGAALYILRPGDVPEGKEADSYYTRGICVY